MAVDTVTLELSGDVSLDEFSHAVSGLRALLAALSGAVAQGVSIVWLVDALHALERDSALTAYRGWTDGGKVEDIERVVRAYGEVGSALANGSPITISPIVESEARSLAGILNGRVHSLRFETPETDATVLTGALMSSPESIHVRPSIESYGAVEGRVQTLSSRGGLRFTLYDTLHDRAVSCYLSEGFDQELMRDTWGRRAFVEGRVKRDGFTGRPLTVRQVRSVVVQPEGLSHDFATARGVAPPLDEIVTAELAIRRVRDGA